MSSFEECTENYWNWLNSVAKYKISPKIDIRDYRDFNEGRSIVAVEDIEENEVLFDIPLGSILNVNTSDLFAKYTEGYVDGTAIIEEIGSWETLILCLFYEMFVKKSASWWSPYFDVLPSDTEFNSLMYWDELELQNLKPSLILDRIGKEQSIEMHKKLQDLITQKLNVIPLKLFTWSNFLLVASIIMAYSFDIGNDDQDEEEDIEEDEIENEQSSQIKSMIPLADTLNADTRKVNANLIYDSGSLRMCAIKPISSGEQVYNTYGDHPNVELLRRYGYVELNGTANEFGELPLSTIVEALVKYFKLDAKYNNFIEKIINTIKESAYVRELTEDEDICLSTYDLYKDGEVMTEAVVLIQILCSLLQVDDLIRMCPVDFKACLDRTTKLAIQLVSGKDMVTRECDNVWQFALEIRFKEYPIHCSREPSPLDGKIEQTSLRERMAHVAIQSEATSISNCIQSIQKKYKIIDDSKFLKNILKRKVDSSGEGSTNKRLKP